MCVCLFFLGCALLFAFGSAGSPCFFLSFPHTFSRASYACDPLLRVVLTPLLHRGRAIHVFLLGAFGWDVRAGVAVSPHPCRCALAFDLRALFSGSGMLLRRQQWKHILIPIADQQLGSWRPHVQASNPACSSELCARPQGELVLLWMRLGDEKRLHPKSLVSKSGLVGGSSPLTPCHAIALRPSTAPQRGYPHPGHHCPAQRGSHVKGWQ